MTIPPRIEILPGKKFIGKRMTMSFTGNRTHDLWRSFMPRRKDIRNAVDTQLYSIEIYPPSFFTPFDTVPDDMETLESPEGLYAVFLHRGPVSGQRVKSEN
ncbi:MAG TPA: GyrI-like domain-containing protein [Balneolales bacterium]|nr:GyrI-like domain-containing protein [Balneolales bacterium]